MTTVRLAVLGGSSPSTLALVDALAAADGPAPLGRLVLHGRDEERLRAVANYARCRLARPGVRVTSTLALEEALEGATLVLHQIRHGGLQGRAEDEAFAEAYGVAADETLGPAALRCALRMAPGLSRLARALAARCPDAWVLNVANPLGISTALLSGRGVRCVGVCELPVVTVRQVADRLGLPLAALEWSYDGLNHRGFVHDLRVEGRDQLGRLLDRLGAATINGIPRAVIEELGAIPMKYFLLLRPRQRPAGGRAAFLAELGRRVFGELKAQPFVLPPSLGQRDVRWYREAVVPAIRALTSSVPHRLVVNTPGPDGAVAEIRADVSAAGIRPAPGVPPGPRVSAWLHVFAHHERTVLAAVTDPDLETLTAALSADPLLTELDVKPLARALCAYARQEADRPWISA